MIKSFRSQTTFWNVLVIAVALVGFSVAGVFANQARLRSEIDRELRDRARRAPPEGPSTASARRRVAIAGFADVRRPRWYDISGDRLGPVPGPPFDPQALREALGGRSGFTNGVYEGEKVRIYTMPSNSQGVIIGAIQVARETRDIDEIWSSQLATLFWFLPVALAAAAAGAFFLTGRAMRPIAQMKAAASEITERDLSQRLEIQGSDEFAELGQTFNEMISRLGGAFAQMEKAYADLEEAHETQRRFNADASHELRTPLTQLRLATSSALAEGATEEDRRRALVIADQAAESMSRLVQEMLVLAKADAGQLRMDREMLDLRVVVSEALFPFGSGSVSIQTDFPDSPVPVEADRDHLSRIVGNLVGNALCHTPAPGRIDVAVSLESPWAVLRVKDTGEGVAAKHLPHLGERFFRADGARTGATGGSGLGLAICRAIAEAHGGTIGFSSKPGKGLTVEVRLPAGLK